MKVDVELVKRLIAKGKRNKDIALQIGCDPSAISHIRRGAVKGANTTEERVRRFKEALESAVEKSPSGCWLLHTSIHPKTGYSIRSFLGKATMAHIASYRAYVGPVPKGMSVCHTCDIRNCANPKHLFLGTPRDNMQDAVSKGRVSHGEGHYAAILNEDIVRAMRAYYKPEMSWAHVGRVFEVSRGVAMSVITRKSWDHVK